MANFLRSSIVFMGRPSWPLAWSASALRRRSAAMIRRLDPRDNVEYHFICDEPSGVLSSGTSVAGGYMSVSPIEELL